MLDIESRQAVKIGAHPEAVRPVEERERPSRTTQTRSAASRQDTRRLLDNVIALGCVQGANFILPLLTLPYLARVLGPQRFGLVAFAQSTIQYFIILTDFGFTLSATRAISVRRDDPAAVSTVFCSVLVIKAVLATIGAAALTMALHRVPTMRAEAPLFVSAYGMVIGSVLFPIWFFQGMERMRFVAALTVLAKAIFTVAVFTAVTSQSDYVLVPLLNSTGSIVAGVLSLWLTFRSFRVRLRWPGYAALRDAFVESVGYFGSRVSVTVYTCSNVFLLGFAQTPLAVGLYSSAEKVYGAMQGIYSPVTNALLPYMARTRNRALFLRITIVTSAANAVLCGALVFFSEQVVRYAFGPSFAGAAPVLRLLAIATMFVLPTFLLGYPFLAAFGHASYANGSTIAGSVIHLAGLAALLAIHRLDPVHVAALVVATEASVLFIRIYAVHRTGIWRSA